jgi:hypothetical protein
MGGEVMPDFVVYFEREVTERATLICDAADRVAAIYEAEKILTESDWEREEMVVNDPIATRLRECR